MIPMVTRIPSGIPGLDQILNGGLVKNSIISVVGGSGTGKSIMALQYVLRGLIRGEHILYLSLEERPKKLLEEAAAIGLSQFSEFPDVGSMFHYVTGDRIIDFFREVLPNLTRTLQNQVQVHTRVVIDPITPLLWETGSSREQRKLLVEAYDMLRKLGTVFQTVEEDAAYSTAAGTLSIGSVPIYLSDIAFHTQNIHIGGPFSRTVRIIKSRGTSHREGLFPLRFVHGAGAVIQAPFDNPSMGSMSKKSEEARGQFEHAIQRVVKVPPNPEVANLKFQLQEMQKSWTDETDPTPVIQILLEEFGLA